LPTIAKQTCEGPTFPIIRIVEWRTVDTASWSFEAGHSVLRLALHRRPDISFITSEHVQHYET
jgi:hypothetical protein